MRDRSGRRAAGLGFGAVVLVAAVWWGQAPPRSAGAYEQRAIATVEYLQSQVRTAGLWLDAVQGGRVPHQAAEVALEELESDARATAGRFAGWDPPAGGTKVRTRVTALGTEVTDALAALRVAAHQGHWDALGQGAALQPLDAQLEALLHNLERDGVA